MSLVLLTEAEVASKIRIKPETLRQWRSLGRGPRFTKVGRRVFYPSEWLLQWLREQIPERQRAAAGEVD